MARYSNAAVSRRDFLRGAGAALLVAESRGLYALAPSSPPFRVGVGHEPDPYAATMRAIEASTDWTPALVAGRRVVVKPNLVIGLGADTGTVTDPEVVRAIVDLALQNGAAEILIVEAGVGHAFFTECGYDFFNTYDPLARVRLVDLATEPVVLANVPGGLAYRQMYLPALLFEPDTVLVSAAKLKVHQLAQVTLSMKNLFGLPPQTHYLSPGRTAGRYALHDRSVNQSTVDINLARPIDFAVVDGIWGMERQGPYGGDPVRMDLVLAGRNAVAVDLVCLAVMGIPGARVQHLNYAVLLGLGPTSANQIELRGDSLIQRAFVPPPAIPLVQSYPRATPPMFAPGHGETTSASYSLDQAGMSRVEIVATSETNPAVVSVRNLRDWGPRPAGLEQLSWDGRDTNGTLVPPGRYGIRVTTKSFTSPNFLYTMGWVRVAA